MLAPFPAPLPARCGVPASSSSAISELQTRPVRRSARACGAGSGALLLVLVLADFLELGVDDVVRLGAAGFGSGRRTTRFGRSLARLVDGFAELHRSLEQLIGAGFDPLHILAGECALERLDRGLDRALLFRRNLVAILLQRLLGGMDERFAVILGLHQFAALLILGGIGLGILDHLL